MLYYPARNRDGTAIANHRLGNIIFLKVELLIDAFKFIVRYGTFHPNFHHFDRFELDLRRHIQVWGAAFSCPRLKSADMVLI